MIKVKAIIAVLFAMFCLSTVSFAAYSVEDVKAYNDAKVFCHCKASKTNLRFRQALAYIRFKAGLSITPWQKYMATQVEDSLKQPLEEAPRPIITEVTKTQKPATETIIPVSKTLPYKPIVISAFIILGLFFMGVGLSKTWKERRQNENVVAPPKHTPEIIYAQKPVVVEPTEPPILSILESDLKDFGTEKYFEPTEQLVGKSAQDYFDQFVKIQT